MGGTNANLPSSHGHITVLILKSITGSGVGGGGKTSSPWHWMQIIHTPREREKKQYQNHHEPSRHVLDF